jgi:hypothetical protein
MLAIFGMLFYDSARPGEPTTRCRTNGVFGQNICQRLGELAIKRRNVCAATHDLRKGWDQPALTAIFLSTLRASAVFGRVTVSTTLLEAHRDSVNIDAFGDLKGELEWAEAALTHVVAFLSLLSFFLLLALDRQHSALARWRSAHRRTRPRLIFAPGTEAPRRLAGTPLSSWLPRSSATNRPAT